MNAYIKSHFSEKILLLLYVIAAIYPVYILSFILSNEDKSWLLSHTILHDDAFYYLKIASRYATSGEMTFSGVGVTTGFHPLWGYLLAWAASYINLSSDVSINTLIAYLSLSFILSALFLRVNYSIFNVNNQSSALSLLLTYIFLLRFFYDGMESGLTLFLYSVFVSFAAIALLPWARVDSLFFMPFILAFFAHREYKLSGRIVYLVIIQLIAVLCASMALKYLVRPVQISENVKTFWFTLDLLSFVERGYGLLAYVAYATKVSLGAVMRIFEPIYALLSPRLLYNSGDVGSHHWLITISLVLTIQQLIARLKSSHRILLLMAFLASSLYLFIVSFFGFYKIGWDWYLALPCYVVIGCISLCIDSIGIQNVKKSLILIMLVGFGGMCTYINYPKDDEWRSVYKRMVDELANIDVKSRVGTWAAGQVGFYSHVDIVNLEGLVEAPAVLDASIKDDIRPVISSYNIEYILTKRSVNDINHAVNSSSNLRFRGDIRDRVFKDLNYELKYQSDKDGRQMFSLLKVSVDNKK
jgi:hypothetical protein